jgi:hypothetical protein
VNKNDYVVGGFVRYNPKNELGLVGEVTDIGLRCWYSLGGTRAMTPYDIVESVDLTTAINGTFSNEYAKKSLIERHMRLLLGEDVSDLIDTNDISPEVQKLISEYKVE